MTFHFYLYNRGRLVQFSQLFLCFSYLGGALRLPCFEASDGDKYESYQENHNVEGKVQDKEADQRTPDIELYF